MEQTAPTRNRGRCWAAVAVGLLVFVFTRIRGELWFYRVFHAWLRDLGVPPHIRNLDSAVWIVLATLVAARFAGRSHALRHLGMTGSLRQGMLFGFAASVPMIVQAAITCEQLQFGWATAKGVLIAPFVEEAFFRGLLVAIPVCLASAPFWPTAIASSVLFGALHVPWTGEFAGHHVWTILITGVGGLWYAWILRVYRWNLWTTIALHMGMNAAWLVFGVSGGAVGSGLWPNVGRALTIALGTGMALRHRRAVTAAD